MEVFAGSLKSQLLLNTLVENRLWSHMGVIIISAIVAASLCSVRLGSAFVLFLLYFDLHEYGICFKPSKVNWTTLDYFDLKSGRTTR